MPSCDKICPIKIKNTKFYFCFKTFLEVCINALAMLKSCFDNYTTLFLILDHHDFWIFSDRFKCIGFHTVQYQCTVRFSDFRVGTPSCDKICPIKTKNTKLYFCFKTFLEACINALAMLKSCFGNYTTLFLILDPHDFWIFQMHYPLYSIGCIAPMHGTILGFSG